MKTVMVMVRKRLELDGRDPDALCRRVDRLCEAIGIRGGKLLNIAWDSATHGGHALAVTYEVATAPSMAPAGPSMAPAGPSIAPAGERAKVIRG